MKKESEITINIEGESRRVRRLDYVKAKTKDFREFGYPSLTEEEVSEQLDVVLSGKGTLTVIGHFMKDEVITQGAK